MATSGTRTFNLQIDDIIDEAFDRIGGDPETGRDAAVARRALNLILIDWQNRAIPLWELTEQTNAFVSGTETYTAPTGTIDVLDVIRRTSTGNDLALRRISMGEYEALPNKTQTGTPSQYLVKRGRSDVTITLWPVPDNSTDSIRYWCWKRIEDITASLQDPDIPFRFLPALVAALAYRLAMSKPNDGSGAWSSRLSVLKAEADELLQRAMENDRERASFILAPEIRNPFA